MILRNDFFCMAYHTDGQMYKCINCKSMQLFHHTLAYYGIETISVQSNQHWQFYKIILKMINVADYLLLLLAFTSWFIWFEMIIFSQLWAVKVRKIECIRNIKWLTSNLKWFLADMFTWIYSFLWNEIEKINKMFFYNFFFFEKRLRFNQQNKLQSKN